MIYKELKLPYNPFCNTCGPKCDNLLENKNFKLAFREDGSRFILSNNI